MSGGELVLPNRSNLFVGLMEKPFVLQRSFWGDLVTPKTSRVLSLQFFALHIPSKVSISQRWRRRREHHDPGTLLCRRPWQHVSQPECAPLSSAAHVFCLRPFQEMVVFLLVSILNHATCGILEKTPTFLTEGCLGSDLCRNRRIANPTCHVGRWFPLDLGDIRPTWP